MLARHLGKEMQAFDLKFQQTKVTYLLSNVDLFHIYYKHGKHSKTTLSHA